MPFDDEVVRAVRDGDLPALAALDPGLARELMVTGRPAWQVLCGALGPGRPVTEVLYTGAPFGVACLVARIDPGHEAGRVASVGVQVHVHSWVRMDVQMKARPR